MMHSTLNSGGMEHKLSPRTSARQTENTYSYEMMMMEYCCIGVASRDDRAAGFLHERESTWKSPSRTWSCYSLAAIHLVVCGWHRCTGYSNYCSPGQGSFLHAEQSAHARCFFLRIFTRCFLKKHIVLAGCSRPPC
jgi:hypothetical protein